MTKFHLVLALSAGMLAASAQAQSHSTGEIGYARGSLGYDAIVSGDFRTAEAQIENARDIDAADPARLINLGYIHMRTGRIQTAQRLFEAARDARRPVMLVLANGEVMSSRDIAERALDRISPSLANR
jgi:Flp pilus assembly protein TadD